MKEGSRFLGYDLNLSILLIRPFGSLLHPCLSRLITYSTMFSGYLYENHLTFSIWASMSPNVTERAAERFG